VVAPQPLETERKGQKTDRLDARALLRHLGSYLEGDQDAMSVVAVPTPEQEQQRWGGTLSRTTAAGSTPREARGRALLLTQAILMPGGWWRPAV
jgi:hypothetical protein